MLLLLLLLLIVDVNTINNVNYNATIKTKDNFISVGGLNDITVQYTILFVSSWSGLRGVELEWPPCCLI